MLSELIWFVAIYGATRLWFDFKDTPALLAGTLAFAMAVGILAPMSVFAGRHLILSWRRNGTLTGDDEQRLVDQSLLGRKSVLVGMLTSGVVIANAAATAGEAGPSSITATTGVVPPWLPSTYYELGQKVVSPTNNVVSARVAHRSSATYGPDVANWLHSPTSVGKPNASDLIFVVSPRGSDANDGLSFPTAKATIAGALTAARGGPCVILLAAGTHTIATGVALDSGTVLRGAGTALTTLNFTGAGAAFTSSQPGVRTYSWRMSDFTLAGPGKAVVGTVGVDLDSVSSAHLLDVIVTGFAKGIRIRSAVSGGAVYSRLTNTTVIACDTGLSIEASSSNATTLDRCRACSCSIGVHIFNSNDTVMHACQIESNTVGVHIEASSTALADNNAMNHCRFEGNTRAWETTPYVRQTLVTFPHVFGTYVISDLGSDTAHWGNTSDLTQQLSSALQSPAGSWCFERSAEGGAETPAMVLRDSATDLGTPVTCQIETQRSDGYFLRGTRAQITHFDVSALDGSLRLPTGGNVELSARTTDSPAPTTAGVRLYAKTVGSKTALFARFPAGAIVQVAIEP